MVGLLKKMYSFKSLDLYAQSIDWKEKLEKKLKELYDFLENIENLNIFIFLSLSLYVWNN